MTCKDCIHYEACKFYTDKTKFNLPKNAENCGDFKDKRLILELPCKVGEYVYDYCKSVNKIVPYEIEDIHIDKEQTRFFATAFDIYYNEYLDEIEFTEDDIEKNVFFTKEAAEAKLKELKENAE